MHPYYGYPYHAFYDWCHPAHRGNYLRPGYVHAPYPYAPYAAEQEASLSSFRSETRDQGPNPYVLDIEKETERNNFFRVAIWTGNHLQVTLMSIPVGQDIGLEIHPNVDQFLRIEEGEGLVQMGPGPDRLDYQRKVEDGSAILIPAGTWHNLTNIGNEPLKLYSIYSPPQHPHGAVHRTKAEAMAAEGAMS